MANNKIGWEYYAVDTNRYQDIKIKRLKKKFGPEGLSVHDYILCEIYRVKGYYIAWDNSLSFDVADYFDIEESTVIDIVNFCVEVGLFDALMLSKENILTSKAIQRRFVDWSQRAKRKSCIIQDNYNIIPELVKIIPNNAGNINQDSVVLPQSKVKESKEEKSNYEEAVDNARAQEIESAINDYCNHEQPSEEKEKSCAQKEKQLPTLDEAVRYIEATANWTRNVFEHYLYVGQKPAWDKLPEDQKQIYYDQRLKLFKYFYEQKEDAYRVRYPTSSEMSSNFYFWISTIKRLNKLNGILNGNGESELTIDKFKNTFASKSTAKDKRNELLNLTDQSQEFLRRTAG